MIKIAKLFVITLTSIFLSSCAGFAFFSTSEDHTYKNYNESPETAKSLNDLEYRIKKLELKLKRDQLKTAPKKTDP